MWVEYYAQIEHVLSAGLCAFAMVGMGATLTAGDFAALFKRPQGILLVLLVQVVVTPCVALLLARWLSLPVGIAAGMLLVSALPGGAFSNVFAYWAKSNVPLSISATAVCTLASLATTVVVLRTFGARLDMPAEVQMPVADMLREIFLFLLAPLLTGMAVRRFWPTMQGPVAKYCLRISTVMLVMLIAAGLASGRLRILEYGWRAPLALILMALAGLAVCYPLGWILRAGILDSYTAAIEVVVRNAHLGLLLKAQLFPAGDEDMNKLGDAVLFAILCYGGVSLVVGGAMVISRRIELRVMGDKHPAPPPASEPL